MVSIYFIILSILVFCIKTVPTFRVPSITVDSRNNAILTETTPHPSFFVADIVCNIWFLFEFLVRLFTCPNKRKFFKSGVNMIDLVSVLAYYVQLALAYTSLKNASEFLGIIRIFRFIKLMQHSVGMSIMLKTFSVSAVSFPL